MSNLVYPGLVKGLTYTVLKTPEWATIVQSASSGKETRLNNRINPIWHYTLIYDYLYANWPGPNNTEAYAPWSDLDTLLGFFLARQGKYDDFLFEDPNANTASGILRGIWQALRKFPVNTVIVDPSLHCQQVIASVSPTAATQPTWNDSGGTTVDGGITWQDLGIIPLFDGYGKLVGYGFTNQPVTLQYLPDGLGNFYSPIQRTIGGLFNEDVTDIQPGSNSDGTSLFVYGNGGYINPTLTGAYTLQGPGLALPGSSFGGMYLKWNIIPALPLTATFKFYFRMRFEEDTQDFENWAQGLYTIGGNAAKNGAGTLKLITSRPATV